MVEIHEVKRGHDGKRDRHADDYRGAELPKKKQEHHDRQKNPDQRGLLHLADGFIDKLALIADDGEIVAGQRQSQPLYGAVDFLHRLDGIVLCLFVNPQSRGSERR